MDSSNTFEPAERARMRSRLGVPTVAYHAAPVDGEPALMLAIRCWERQMSLIIAHTKWDIVNGPRLLPLNGARLPPRQPEPTRLSIDLVVDMCPLSGTVAKGVARWVRAKDEVLASKECSNRGNGTPCERAGVGRGSAPVSYKWRFSI